MLSSSDVEENHDENDLFNQDIDQDQDQDLFPASEDSSRPELVRQERPSGAALAELSPPQSQSASQSGLLPAATSAESGGILDNAAGLSYGGQLQHMNGSQKLPAQRQEQGQEQGQLEGTDSFFADLKWKTEKAREEYLRVMETMADGDFTLREFDDIFDDRTSMQQQQQQQQHS